VATNGDRSWPPVGTIHGRQRGDPLTATGEKPVTVDMLCGPPGSWDTRQLSEVRERYHDTLLVLYMTREAAPGTLHDVDGQAFSRLGVGDTAQYLIRPDGHVGYRAGDTHLDGLDRYLARWLPNPTCRA
jgi:hypothetical protein